MKPIINLNGQSAAEHLRLRREALDALKAAKDAVSPLLPHGRDYPGDMKQCDADRDEYAQWRIWLNTIEAQILSDALDIQKGEI